MSTLQIRIHALTTKWRTTAANTRLATAEIPNLMARGHMYGMSDGLDIAAHDVDHELGLSSSARKPGDAHGLSDALESAANELDALLNEPDSPPKPEDKG